MIIFNVTDKDNNVFYILQDCEPDYRRQLKSSPEMKKNVP